MELQFAHSTVAGRLSEQIISELWWTGDIQRVGESEREDKKEKKTTYNRERPGRQKLEEMSEWNLAFTECKYLPS